MNDAAAANVTGPPVEASPDSFVSASVAILNAIGTETVTTFASSSSPNAMTTLRRRSGRPSGHTYGRRPLKTFQ